jgi:flagellar capping protein FliD
MTKFMAMEEALSQLKSESTYLDNQLAAMNANWSFNN